MASITANVVVNFDAGEGDGLLIAEVDDRDDGLNGGNTNFKPGDTVGLLIFKSSNVTITDIITSAGSLSGAGTQTKDVSDIISFPKEKTQNVRYPINGGGFTFKWLGNNLGTISHTEVNVTCANLGVGVAKVSYSSTADGHNLTSPTSLDGETTFDILVYVEGIIEE